MTKRATPYDIAKFKNLNLEFTNTLRNEFVSINSLQSNFVIGVDGIVYKNNDSSGNTATVILIGGLSTFTNEKIYRKPSTYLTIYQKRTLHNIARHLAINFSNAKINSSNQELRSFLKISYSNSLG